jgi:hypothetical protein
VRVGSVVEACVSEEYAVIEGPLDIAMQIVHDVVLDDIPSPSIPSPYCICVCPQVVSAPTSRAYRAMHVWCGEQPPPPLPGLGIPELCVCVRGFVDDGADADEHKLVKSYLSCNLGRWVVLQTILDCRLLAEPKGPRSRQDRRAALRIWGICSVTPTPALSSLLGNPRCRSQTCFGCRRQDGRHVFLVVYGVWRTL